MGKHLCSAMLIALVVVVVIIAATLTIVFCVQKQRKTTPMRADTLYLAEKKS